MIWKLKAKIHCVISVRNQKELGIIPECFKAKRTRSGFVLSMPHPIAMPSTGGLTGPTAIPYARIFTLYAVVTLKQRPRQWLLKIAQGA